MLEFKLQRFAEDVPQDTPADNTPQTVKIGDKDFTLDELSERMKSYDKLQAQFTKVSQEASELRKNSERAQSWLQFEEYVNQFPPEVRAELGQTIETFLAAKQSGTVTQKDITGINKAIRAAEKAGETETADALKSERDEALEEYKFDKALRDLGKEAKKEGFSFDEDEFTDYLQKYLKDEDLIDEDGSFDDRHIRVVYRLYKADKKAEALEKERKDSLPDVGSGGSGVGPGFTKPDKSPKTLKEAHDWVMGRRK